MFNILKKTIKTGVVTTKYPHEQDNAPKGFRGKPDLFPEKCTFCGDCAGACPTGALQLDEKESEKILTLSCGGCIFCGRCEDVCTADAIRLTEEYEMASKTKNDLDTVIRRRL